LLVYFKDDLGNMGQSLKKLRRGKTNPDAKQTPRLPMGRAIPSSPVATALENYK